MRFLSKQHTRTDTYRGVELLVIAERQPTGRWVWSHLIGDIQGRLRGAQLPTAEAALTQAMNAARDALARDAGAERVPGTLEVRELPDTDEEKSDRHIGMHRKPDSRPG